MMSATSEISTRGCSTSRLAKLGVPCAVLEPSGSGYGGNGLDQLSHGEHGDRPPRQNRRGPRLAGWWRRSNAEVNPAPAANTKWKTA